MKQILAFLALALLLFVGLNCGTENPIEETVDATAIETDATGAFYGDVELIEGVTIYMRLLKAEQLLAQIEFKTNGVKTTSSGNANLFASTRPGVGNRLNRGTTPSKFQLKATKQWI